MATEDCSPTTEPDPVHHSLSRVTRWGLLGILLVSVSGWSFTRIGTALYPQESSLDVMFSAMPQDSLPGLPEGWRQNSALKSAQSATPTEPATQPAQLQTQPQAQRQNVNNRTYGTSTVVTVHHSRIPPAFRTNRMRLAGIAGDNRLKSFATTGTNNYRPYKKSRSFSLHKVAASESYSKHQSLQLTTPLFHFDGVGFPHVETNKRPVNARYKPYRELLVSMRHSDGNNTLIPNVRCWGYTPAQTWRRAKAYDAMIKVEADRNGISEHLVKAVIARESCFRPQALSPVGARGLMQLMPATAQWLGVTDLESIEQNLSAGTRYLAQQLRRFENPSLALAAYNAGPGAVARHGDLSLIHI